MKRFGIVSYNIYCNFTNYGSALQTWALQQAADRLGDGRWETVVVDYCPDVLRDKDPRDPISHMWDKDPGSRRMCELSLPAIRENADKFDHFYAAQLRKTKRRYTSENFGEVVSDEGLDGFICGSDTIFCIDEFGGFDDGYYANYPCMKGRSCAYAASFGDAHFTPETFAVLNERLQNFKAIGLREGAMMPYVRNHVSVPVERVLDPTLLLKEGDYAPITAPRLEDEPYLLLYARRYDPRMEAYAERLAAENGWKVVEISLRAENAGRHRVFYEAGVEEFLSLVKYARFVVTNSYHGMIFSVQFHRDFRVFIREQCSSKISELLELLGFMPQGAVREDGYGSVYCKIAEGRAHSLGFLERTLAGAADQGAGCGIS